MANGGGGRREGAGRLSDEQVRKFRKYWRDKFDKPRWRKWLAMKALKNDRLLVELIRHAYGAPPQAIDVKVEATQGTRQVQLPGVGDFIPAGSGVSDERPN